jgi:hypothetical protein
MLKNGRLVVFSVACIIGGILCSSGSAGAHIRTLSNEEFFDKVFHAPSAAVLIMCPESCDGVDSLVESHSDAGPDFDYSSLPVYKYVKKELKEPGLYIVGPDRYGYYERPSFHPTVENIADVMKYISAVADGFNKYNGAYFAMMGLDHVLDGRAIPQRGNPETTAPPTQDCDDDENH